MHILYFGLNSRTFRDINIPNSVQWFPLLTNLKTFPLKMDAVHESQWLTFGTNVGYLRLVAVLIQKCAIFHTVFSILSQRSYHTIFVCVCHSLSSAFVVVWVERHGQYTRVTVRNLYACERRQRKSLCMHAPLRPFQLWFQENLAWPWVEEQVFRW